MEGTVGNHLSLVIILSANLDDSNYQKSQNGNYTSSQHRRFSFQMDQFDVFQIFQFIMTRARLLLFALISLVQ